jgi:hypothetical protein
MLSRWKAGARSRGSFFRISVECRVSPSRRARTPVAPPLRPFDFAQGKLLRLRSGQAPSTSLRASSFDFAQGKLLRLRSGQAPSTSLRAGSFDFAQGRLLRLRSGQAPSTSLKARSFDFAQGRLPVAPTFFIELFAGGRSASGQDCLRSPTRGAFHWPGRSFQLCL